MRCPSCGQDGRQVGSSQTFECPACGAVYLQSQGRSASPKERGAATAAERTDAAKLALIHERAEQERLAKAAAGANLGQRFPARGTCWLPWALVSIVALTGGAMALLPRLINGTAAAGSLEALAQAGDPAAQLSLGMVHDHGLGSAPRNSEDARRWYKKAAEGGSADAQFHLGQWYLSRAPQPDPREAVFWLRAAAERGRPAAQALLGTLYLSGQGVERNLAQAEAWYRRAAEQRHAEALCGLARLNAGAEVGYPQDPPAAAMYDHLAKALGKDCGLRDYGATAKLADWAKNEGARRAQERLAAGFGPGAVQ